MKISLSLSKFIKKISSAVLSNNSGQLIVEVLVVMGLMTLLLPALTTAIITSKQGQAQRQNRFEGSALVRETVEALRVVRENDWLDIAVDGTYHPVVNGSTWGLNPGNETINELTRSIIIESVQRNLLGEIVDSGGVVDPSTKKISIVVAWLLPYPGNITSQFYLTRYLDNLTYTETSELDFQTGTHEGTSAVNNAGGEVTLGSGGQGNWCEPTDALRAELDLPKNGAANAISALPGKIYSGTGENASGVSFAKVLVTNEDPPVLAIEGTLDGYKTNDVFAEENYVYIATDDNVEEVVIINLNVTPYAKLGYFNSPGSANAQAVATSGTTGYVLQDSMLYNFDLTSKSGSRPGYDTDGVALAGLGSAIEVVGDYAYVAINGTGSKMQIIDVTDKNNLQIVAQVTTSVQGAKAIAVNDTGTRAYLATGTSASQNEVFIIDTSNKSGNLPVLGSYDTNGMDPRAVNIVPGNTILVGGHNGEEYQSINISNETSPTRCGGLEVPEGINDIASVLEADGDAYSYVLTASTNNELRVLEGGPGGQYASDGTYISKALELNYARAFNYVEAHYTAPNQTTAMFQIAVADTVNGSCLDADYQFVGADGTSGSFYDTEGAIALNDDGLGYENPGSCFKYKVYLQTLDAGSTPLFNDITVNYSP